MPRLRCLTLLCVLLAMSTPALAQAAHGEPLHFALGAYMGASGADLFTTAYALGTGRGREANPLFAPFTAHPAAAGAVKMGAAAFTSWVLLKVHPQHPKLAFILAAAGTAFYSSIAWHNSRVIARHPRAISSR